MSAVRRLRRLLVLGAVALAPAALLAGVGPAAATDGGTAARGVPTCFGQRATIVATARGGALRGTAGDDVIVGRGGKDRIDGLGGTDRICGGGGKDRLTLTEPGMVDGGPGDDRILGSDGADRLAGGRDDDHISADGGDDVQVDGGPGDDLVDGGAGIDRLDGGPGDDDLWSGAGAGGNGLLDGQEGEDLLVAQAGGITLLGGPDDDTIRLGGGPDGSARGEDGDDRITGSDHADVIDGGEDADVIDARGGDDVAVTGGAGADRVSGGAGDDRLQGGPGTDVCDGGADDDTCDGGSPGQRGNTPTDPDRCTAEELLSCRGTASRSYTGTASGEMSYGGVTETWTATFLTQPLGDSAITQGPATITWTISGTDTESGCTYEGSDGYEGVLSITLWEPLEQYGIELRSLHSADVEVDCPLTPPETRPWWALNGGVGDGLQDLPADPTVLTGTETYSPRGYPDVTHAWRWNARTRS